MAETDLFIGKEPTTFDFEGTPVVVGPATVVRAGHPIMNGREHLFTPLVVHFDVAAAGEPPPANKARTRAADK